MATTEAPRVPTPPAQRLPSIAELLPGHFTAPPPGKGNPNPTPSPTLTERSTSVSPRTSWTAPAHHPKPSFASKPSISLLMDPRLTPRSSFDASSQHGPKTPSGEQLPSPVSHASAGSSGSNITALPPISSLPRPGHYDQTSPSERYTGQPGAWDSQRSQPQPPPPPPGAPGAYHHHPPPPSHAAAAYPPSQPAYAHDPYAGYPRHQDWAPPHVWNAPTSSERSSLHPPPPPVRTHSYGAPAPPPHYAPEHAYGPPPAHHHHPAGPPPPPAHYATAPPPPPPYGHPGAPPVPSSSAADDYYAYSRLRRKRCLPDATKKLLKGWFNEHLHNPYPTVREKQMLMAATGLKATQINTWFNNVRRRQLPSMTRKARAKVYASMSKRNEGGL